MNANRPGPGSAVQPSRGGREGGAQGRPWAPQAVFLALLFVGPLAPTMVNLVETLSAWSPERHEDWLGDRFFVSRTDARFVPDDPSGVASVIATIASWDARSVDDAALLGLGGSNGVENALADGFRAFGLEGRWEAVDRRVPLDAFALPFIALVADESGVVPVVVRALEPRFAYGFDPRVGNVMYPRARFERSRGDTVFTFDHPPRLPWPDR